MQQISVVIEGIDGCGKSTQAKILTEKLKALQFNFPDDSTPFGKIIRAHLRGEWWCDAVGSSKDPLPDAAVFQALQLANRMEKALELSAAMETGNVVICRYWPSGVAYGSADGLDPKWLVDMHQSLPQPDLFLLLDAPVDLCLARMEERRAWERYEKKGFLEGVRDRYNTFWATHRQDPGWATISAVGTVEATAHLIEKTVEEHRKLMDGS